MVGILFFDDIVSSLGPRQDVEAAKKFILKMYVEQHVGRHQPLYNHFTCATDTENIRVVFKAARDTVFRENLDRYGLQQETLLRSPDL